MSTGATNDPRVSVIVPFLDEEAFLAQAVASVQAQTFRSWELLLIDDGSTDGSAAMAREFASGTPEQIRYLQHDGHVNRGLSASRNLGLRLASGEYVAFLDADDVWLPWKLERQVALLDAHTDAAAVFGAPQYWHSHDGGCTSRDVVPDSGIRVDTVHQPPGLMPLLYPLGPGAAPCPSDLLVRRASAVAVGGFEETFTGPFTAWEDQPLLAKLYSQFPLFVSSETWTRYRVHPASCSAAMERRGDQEVVRRHFLEWLRDYLLSTELLDLRVWNPLHAALRSSTAASATGDPRWTLRTANGAVASLQAAADGAGSRVAIMRRPSNAHVHDVQLNWTGPVVARSRRYVVELEARADAPRTAAIGFAMAHEPWSGLGLYEHFELSPEWTPFCFVFFATDGGGTGRLHIDLGQHAAAAEFRSIRLIDAATGEQMDNDEGASRWPSPETFRSLTPVSRNWGIERGLPLDRFYIEAFLREHASDIRGHVLEIEDDVYTSRYGSAVDSVDILHVTDGNPRATVVADLSDGHNLASGQYDCIVLTQTLQLIYDTRAALATLHRILKPGGVLLATFPGITRTSTREWEGRWYWSFTRASAERLFAEAFRGADIAVRSYGNVLASTAFLYGLATEDLTAPELEARDPEYEMLIAVRVQKGRA